ncbi:hypothetical protein ABH944_001577 [Caballeronia udeis]|uniref:Uncharacterized protein n=1 Tax=Caballeronia udeis TaxID=1232866 RepID=A0ABW8MDY6_9BURK
MRAVLRVTEQDLPIATRYSVNRVTAKIDLQLE